MSRQESARIVLRSQWASYCDEPLIVEALEAAQAEESASRTLCKLWPAMSPEDMVRLDRCDDSLFQGHDAIPASFWQILANLVFKKMTASPPPSSTENAYLRGSKLFKLITEHVQYNKDSVRRSIDTVFEKHDTDKLARPKDIQTKVIEQIAIRCFDELKTMGPGPEDIPKRHLKCLTALCMGGGDTLHRKQIFQQITDGTTAAFPYVLKYIKRGEAPKQASFDSEEPCLDGFTAELLTLSPLSVLIQASLARYMRNEGILLKYCPADAPIDPQHVEAFQRLPAEVQLRPGGLLIPKDQQLSRLRTEQSRLPDGIVCAVALGILLEWLLNQIAYVLKVTPPSGARGHQVVRAIQSKLSLSPDTLRSLEVVFSEDSLALRDSLAHAAFFANDPEGVHAIIGGLTGALKRLMRDLETHGIRLGTTPWDASEIMSASDETLFSRQYTESNLVEHPASIELQRHVSTVAKRLSPDKHLLEGSARLLWADLQGTHKRGDEPDEAAELVALIGSLLALEDIFRAVAESKGVKVLTVSEAGSDALCCGLAILADQEGGLLDQDVLHQLFGPQATEADFIECVRGVHNLRNNVMHGHWHVLTAPLVKYYHLVVKIIFALCCTVRG